MLFVIAPSNFKEYFSAFIKITFPLYSQNLRDGKTAKIFKNKSLLEKLMLKIKLALKKHFYFSIESNKVIFFNLRTFQKDFQILDERYSMNV